MAPLTQPDLDPPRRPARALLAGLAILGGVLLGAWLWGTPPGVWGKADAVGYAICHRIAERSFHAHDRALPLCARCTGIYLGVLLGLGVALARGRGRAGRLPPVRVLIPLVLLGMAYFADGLNSYFSLFDFYTPLYEPHNTLRLLTGLGFGLGLIAVALPLFNALAWRAPQPVAPVASLRELALLLALAGLAAAGVLVGGAPLRIALGWASAAGVVLMFGLVGGAAFLGLARRENSLRAARDLLLPAAAGLVFALLVIGAIDLLRHTLTGTWAGFSL